MSTKYKATTTEDCYFMTLTIVEWIDVFTRPQQKHLITNALKYCQENKGMEIYAYCLMPSHLHLLAKAVDGHVMADTIRDFKKYTSKKIIETGSNGYKAHAISPRIDVILEFVKEE